ncbi:MAG TPA: GDP-mannose 4,6-dehydratase, partial [Thermoanaerobaculia bacterium]|nr:GDP-mannose 4,6-dehydratase [Thermoanaerobaculia bacterium]
REWVVVDERLMRPHEVEYLLGDATRARQILGWSPTVTFQETVREMVASDIAILRESMRDQIQPAGLVR